MRGGQHQTMLQRRSGTGDEPWSLEARSLWSEMQGEGMLCLVTDSGKQEDGGQMKTACLRKPWETNKADMEEGNAVREKPGKINLDQSMGSLTLARYLHLTCRQWEPFWVKSYETSLFVQIVAEETKETGRPVKRGYNGPCETNFRYRWHVGVGLENWHPGVRDWLSPTCVPIMSSNVSCPIHIS